MAIPIVQTHSLRLVHKVKIAYTPEQRDQLRDIRAAIKHVRANMRALGSTGWMVRGLQDELERLFSQRDAIKGQVFCEAHGLDDYVPF